MYDTIKYTISNEPFVFLRYKVFFIIKFANFIFGRLLLVYLYL